MKRKKTIVITRSVRVIGYLLFLVFFVHILFLCSQIPLIEKDIPPTHNEQTPVDLDSKNPNKLGNLFILHDLSKAEYKLNYPSGKWKTLWIKGALSDRATCFAVSFSAVEGAVGVADIKDIMAITPTSDDISFYTKNIISENMQMIRNLFLTEIILFLFAMLGYEGYKLLTSVFIDWRYLRSTRDRKSTFKKSMIFYLLMSLLSCILLYCINIVPVNHISSEKYTQKSGGSFFSLYDISCAYQHIQIPSSSRTTNSVEWTSGEIIEFVPEHITTLKNIVGPKSIKFTDVPMNMDVDVTFYACNLQSANYQEIRLFILTTLLLFFLQRSYFYFRKWNKKN